MRSLLCAALCLSPILAQDPEPRPAEQDPGKGTWLVEFAAAQRQAAEEGKDLFLDFTGSDWCVWCQRLSGEVFAKPEFQDYAKEHFVLVELDFPRDASGQTDAVREQNEELQGRFGVQGYPTILLLDSAGRPYAQTGYQPGGEEAYVEHLDELRAIKTERDRHLQAAESKAGVERAKHLAAAVNAVPSDLQRHYLDLIDEVLAADADGAAGLKQEFLAKKLDAAMHEMLAEINGHAREGDWASARKAVEDFLTEHDATLEGEQRQRIKLVQTRVYELSGDLEAALKSLRECQQIDPESQIGQACNEIAAHLEQQLEAQKKKSGGDHDHDHDGGR